MCIMRTTERSVLKWCAQFGHINTHKTLSVGTFDVVGTMTRRHVVDWKDAYKYKFEFL